MTVTDALLAPVLAADPRRPLITFYDDATGERLEFSGETLANWIAKTANLLRDECDVEPGQRVAVLLPAHWQTAVALLGAWWNGAVVVGDPAGADVALADAEHLDAAAAAGLVVGFSLDAFGRPLADLPGDAVDYASEVRMHGDAFAPSPVPGDAPALADASVDDVVGTARRRAAELGYDAGSRVLSTADWPLTPDGDLVDGLLAVLAAGGSLVQVRHADEAGLARRAETERATLR
ncbi:TIGR03089 family protein [Actinomycetospora sp. TBRC 11914]|uniref:TIGR03089 family protein n=1 Tax=Actinomycetospora sp. TBRC 11914 TaxID=2729387 RepID=UPI00145C5012|nr:TIGR03089 family protein [Actinomycetospora sp. TBRC 11914]NMO90792.1 TIGR03089 family protein [Actinomycetospora sp. TBRC 11914]